MAVWIASRTCAVGGLLWLPVPLVGFLRADLAILALAAEAAIATLLCALHPNLPVVMLLAGAATLRFALPHPAVRYNPNGRGAVHGGLVHDGKYETLKAWPGALSEGACDKLLAGVLAHHAEWTKCARQPVPYYSLGLSSNFASADESTPAWWSLSVGFAAAEGHEGQFVLGSRGRFHRERTRALLNAAAWLNEPLRAALATALDVPLGRITFGGEGAIAHLPHPAVQVYLPNIAWSVAINPHTDALIFSRMLTRVGQTVCDDSTRAAFLLPLSTPPPGSGLLYWNMLDANGTASSVPLEHEQDYTRGTLYSWPLTLMHALRAWPYIEWDTSALRVTIQAFGVRCGDDWYFYH